MFATISRLRKRGLMSYFTLNCISISLNKLSIEKSLYDPKSYGIEPGKTRFMQMKDWRFGGEGKVFVDKHYSSTYKG